MCVFNLPVSCIAFDNRNKNTLNLCSAQCLGSDVESLSDTISRVPMVQLFDRGLARLPIGVTEEFESVVI